MSNPFTYYKQPGTVKEAQSNVNYWQYEGMLSTEEIEELGHIPANYLSFINEMKRDAAKQKQKLLESI